MKMWFNCVHFSPFSCTYSIKIHWCFCIAMFHSYHPLWVESYQLCITLNSSLRNKITWCLEKQVYIAEDSAYRIPPPPKKNPPLFIFSYPRELADMLLLLSFLLINLLYATVPPRASMLPYKCPLLIKLPIPSNKFTFSNQQQQPLAAIK